MKTRKLKEQCEMRPAKAEARARLSERDAVSFLPMSDLGELEKDCFGKQERTLSEVEGRYTYFAEGDVLLAKITPCFENGKLGIARGLTNGAGFGSSEYFVLRPGPLLDAEFLYYFLAQDWVRERGAAAMVGAVGHKRVPKEFIENLDVPVLSLPEQKRIVAILDEAFEGIRIATANAEKNLANARELFERRISAALSARGPHWQQMPLSEACVVERGSSPRPIKQFLTTSADGVNWVKIGDTREGEKYVYATKEKITPKGAERSRKVEPGDFILTNSMSFGRPYIMATSGFVHDGWFVLRLKPNIDPDFFYFLLSSRLVQDQFRRLATGAVVQNISSDLVKQAMLLLPPIDEQRSIADLLQRGADERDQMREHYDAKIATCEALKQSILARAFSGQLTATKGLAA